MLKLLEWVDGLEAILKIVNSTITTLKKSIYNAISRINVKPNWIAESIYDIKIYF